MSEEKDLEEQSMDAEGALEDLSSFVDFADLESLAGAKGTDLFGDLGDIADLGDMGDLDDITVDLDDVPDLSGLEDLPDLSDLADLQPEGSFSEPAALEEQMAGLKSVEPGGTSGDNGLPSLDNFMDDVPDGLFEDDEIFAEGAEETPPQESQAMSGLDSLDGMSDLDGLSDLDGVPGLDGMPDLGGISDSDGVSGLDGMPDLDGMSGLDGMPDLDGLSGLGEDSIDDSEIPGLDALDGLSLDDLNVDGVDAMPGLDGLPDIQPEGEAAQAMEAPEAEGGEDLGSMLDGLLTDVDMGDSMDNDTSAGQETSAQSADPLAGILGLASNPFSEDEIEMVNNPDEDIEDMLDLSDVDDMNMEGLVPPSEASEEGKQPGFFKKVFGNVVTDEIAEQERLEAEQEEEAAAIKAEAEEKAKEAKAAKAEEAKAAKEAKAAEKKAIKEARKKEKEEMKAAKKAKEEEEAAQLEVVGKLNKVGVSIVVIAAIIFLAVEIVGTNAFGYISAKNAAVDYFEMGKYTQAYKEAIGTDMREKDPEEYNKIKTVMRVQQSLNAYQNYDRMNYYPEALNSLLCGLKRYDANIEEGMELEVETAMQQIRSQILAILQDEYGLSESKAYEILSLDKEKYTDKVVELGVAKIK